MEDMAGFLNDLFSVSAGGISYVSSFTVPTPEIKPQIVGHEGEQDRGYDPGMTLPDHGRYVYSPITERPDYSWPEGRRLAVYVALNLEHFTFGEGLGAELAAGGPQPDILNYAWRDYGNRVGVWRLLELFESLKLSAAVLANTALYNYCPQVLAAFRARGDEMVAHGRSNSERQRTLSEADERALIAETTAVMTQAEGRPPAGWLGPWISESRHTPDLLKEAGYRYLLDWCCDDQPLWFKTQSGSILSVPYPQEINDIPAIVARRASASEFADMIVDQFDEMLEQSHQQPLVCAVALHAYVVGQPFRLRHLRRALGHIARHAERIWLTRPAKSPPGPRHCHPNRATDCELACRAAPQQPDHVGLREFSSRQCASCSRTEHVLQEISTPSGS
jgi:peptidoglycan/xylan/chitin deacetylase (PgdA/CDA1 family)